MHGSNNIGYSGAMPDMKFINRQVPIQEVARELGLAVRGRKATCPECNKKRLTFSVKYNRWRCWQCDPTGKRKTVIDLVMFILNVDAFNAAAWISRRWSVVSQVQVERSENKHGLTKHVYRRVRQIPVPERDKPNFQAIIVSPGWREMTLSARVVALTLLALARMDPNNRVTIDRKGLSDLTGITDPSTLARAKTQMSPFRRVGSPPIAFFMVEPPPALPPALRASEGKHFVVLLSTATGDVAVAVMSAVGCVDQL